LVENSKETARARADSRFRKAEEASTARQKAMAEHLAEEAARRVKTKKLRELRLAKEAADAAAEAAKPKPAPKRSARAAQK
jgi:hypothetical protein